MNESVMVYILDCMASSNETVSHLKLLETILEQLRANYLHKPHGKRNFFNEESNFSTSALVRKA